MFFSVDEFLSASCYSVNCLSVSCRVTGKSIQKSVSFYILCVAMFSNPLYKSCHLGNLQAMPQSCRAGDSSPTRKARSGEVYKVMKFEILC